MLQSTSRLTCFDRAQSERCGRAQYSFAEHASVKCSDLTCGWYRHALLQLGPNMMQAVKGRTVLAHLCINSPEGKCGTFRVGCH